MKNLFSLKTLVFLLSSGVLFSCKKEDAVKLQTFKGQEISMGNGKAASWFTIQDGIPQELGIEMTAEAFTGLSQDPLNFAGNSFALDVDQKVKDLTPFDHIEADWNPQGHEPAGVFDIPHFDFHFYMISEAEQMAIPPYMPSTAAAFDNLPPAGFMPISYTATPEGLPAMGKHWVDNNMQMPFTHTMIYGSYNGKVNFLEPMITKATLESGAKITMDYAQPIQFEKTGNYYPTKYNIYMDATTHKHYVTLSGFILR